MEPQQSNGERRRNGKRTLTSAEAESSVEKTQVIFKSTKAAASRKVLQLCATGPQVDDLRLIPNIAAADGSTHSGWLPEITCPDQRRRIKRGSK